MKKKQYHTTSKYNFFLDSIDIQLICQIQQTSPV